MRYELLGYQRAAVTEVLERLRWARDDWSARRAPSSFALSAITGSGKTVIATAVIEALMHGSSDLETEADPAATFLWFTDDPALNRQTRAKMLDASDALSPARLVELDRDFLETELLPGRVYFLNTQKLAKDQPLVQSGTNLRALSFWEILANTIRSDRNRLHLVLDEAHRGMKRSADRRSIVQRIVGGERSLNPPFPIVWGISATIERFTTAMGAATSRTAYPPVEVDTERVRSSGLVKDLIGLDKPNESGTYTETLLREAATAALTYERRWAAYAEAEAEPLVLPVFVVQVPDKAPTSKLAEVVGVIESAWPGLGPDAVVHVFGEHEPITLGTRKVDWVPPESIEGDTRIRVVLAKTAISTGWDCPRAEVLYSERPAKDATHIAQVVGRMVRQPLARRITTDDALNSVSCYLPLFDRKALNEITRELTGDADGDGGPGAVSREPRLFERNRHLDPGVFNLVESLPSIPTPDPLASPLRRAKNLVRLLTDDATGTALLPDAGARLTEVLNLRADGLAAERAPEVEANVADFRGAEVSTVVVTTTGTEVDTSTRTIATHHEDLARDTWKAVRAVKEGVGKEYYAYRLAKAGPDADPLDVRTEVAALFLVPRVVEAIEETATKFVLDRFAEFRVEIENTTGAARDAYRKVQEQTRRPEPVPIDLGPNQQAATRDREGNELPTLTGHLYADDEGYLPVDLNDWELAVMRTELSRPSFVAWYRNPSRAQSNSLRIAYQDDSARWSSLQVDFVVVSRRSDDAIAASIVDPHGDHLADAKAKLRALADFAEQYGDQFVRIESVARVSDKSLRSLNLQKEHVRQEVRTFEKGKVTALYEDPAISELYLK